MIEGIAGPDQLASARAEIAGSLIMVDEASMMPNHQFEQVLRLSGLLDARVINAGDTRQLLAVEAGKPFEMTQQHGAPTSHVTQNLRVATPLMTAVNAALEKEDVSAAFAVLKDNTVEAGRDAGPDIAADRWIALPAEQRKGTVLLALSRSMRDATNAAVQHRLRQAGEIGTRSRQLTVLDRVTVTREGARQMRAYQDGRIVAFDTNLAAQGFARGERGTVIGQKGDRVTLRMANGSVKSLDPARIPGNVRHDAVSIHQKKPIAIHEGDRIRWTANDKERGLLNNQLAQVQAIGTDAVTFRNDDGTVHALERGNRMLEKLDLAYALTTHAAQGLTAQSAILVMRSQEKLLNTAHSFLVAATRATSDITLVVDNAQGLERAIARNSGDKTSALEIAGEGKRAEPAAVALPERSIERSR